MSQQTSTVWGLGVADLPTKEVNDFVYQHPSATGEVSITGLVFPNLIKDFSVTLHVNDLTQRTIFRVRQENKDKSLDDQIFEFTILDDKDSAGDLTIEIGRIYGKGVNVKCTIESIVAEGVVRDIQIDLEELVY